MDTEAAHRKRGSVISLNSAVGYIMPKDMLAGRHQEVHAERGIGSWRRRGNNGRFVASRPALCTRSITEFDIAHMLLM